jgi:hypothetical protein
VGVIEIEMEVEETEVEMEETTMIVVFAVTTEDEIIGEMIAEATEVMEAMEAGDTEGATVLEEEETVALEQA